MFVKYSPDITDFRRGFISNGIKSFLSQEALLIDKKTISEGLDSTAMIVKIFLILVGLISLVLTFFLLLVSTSQNIKDNIWEYGVLRSIGLTKEEGKRIYMYEAFVVIVAAGILGIAVGLIVARTLAGQTYLFLELPAQLSAPGGLITLLTSVALITTYFAVKIPMMKINRR